MTDAIIPWCAEARYPGLQPALFGTLTMPADARYDEIEAAMHKLMLKHLPDGFEIMGLQRGALFFRDSEVVER